MAQVIVDNSPGIPEYLQQFLDRFSRNRAQMADTDMRNRQLAMQAEQGKQQAGIQNRLATVQEETLRLSKDETAYKQASETFGRAYNELVAPFKASGRPEDFETAQKNIREYVAQHPDAAPYFGATIIRLQRGQLPEDVANANAGQYDATMTGKANTSTDPIAANYTTRRNLKADMPAQVFQQKQAEDLQARGGGSKSTIPTPTGNAVTDYERRATEGMTTPAQNQVAQTQITTTAMSEAGATKRAGIMAGAKAGAGPIAPIEPGSKEYGVAQDLSSGKLTFQQFTKLYAYSRDPRLKQAIYEAARDINPNFDPASYELGYKFAGNKGVRQQVAAADNALKMIPEAIQISDAATRLGPTALNKLVMGGGVALGGRKYTDAQTLQKAFGDEISGALGFGSATDMTRELGLSMADLNFSSKNFRSAMKVVESFLKNKRGTLVNQMGDYGGTIDRFSGTDTGAPRTEGVVGTYVPGKGLVRH